MPGLSISIQAGNKRRKGFELLACKLTLPEADRQPAESSSVRCFRDGWGSLSFIALIKENQ